MQEKNLDQGVNDYKTNNNEADNTHEALRPLPRLCRAQEPANHKNLREHYCDIARRRDENWFR
jgi:hypothetical protein